MRLSLAAGSLLLFGASVLLLILLTLFESGLVGMPPATERFITFLLLILPAGIGAVFGGISLLRKDGRAWLAVTGLVLNTSFALFHLMLVLFAG